MKNKTNKHLIDEITYKQYAKMHLNPTSMLMKPKQLMRAFYSYVVKISRKIPKHLLF